MSARSLFRACFTAPSMFKFTAISHSAFPFTGSGTYSASTSLKLLFNNNHIYCLLLKGQEVEYSERMDVERSIEDQFSKLHPCLPVNTRIGIVGAGPSGLSAAYALCRLGYKEVTVLEKHHTVGGMCESVEIEGKVYDLGGQVLAASSAPVIFHLAKETGSALEEMDSHKLAVIDRSTGKYQDIKVADDYVSVMSLTLEIQEKVKNSDRIGVHAVSQLASDLTPQYLEGHGLKSVPKSVAYGYTASGYGFVQDMPYAYLHEFTRTSMAGKIRRFKGGYTSLWQKIAESLPLKLHCNTQVLAVRRNSDGVTVNVKNFDQVKTMEFDKIIISGNFPLKYGTTYRSLPSTCTEHETEVMDASDLERDLFSKVETNDYYTTVLKVKGLEDMPIGFYYFNEFMEDPSTIGNPVAIQKFYADTNIFLLWSYGNSVDIMGPTVTELAISAIEAIGGQVENIILQRHMKDGFYDKLELELQGSRNTYYVGGLMAFELTERNSSYAMALICKNFANSNDLPMFPYTKSLFPLQTESLKEDPKELGELPGVQFPDLPTLNGYLKYWGTHPITQNKTLYTWINEEGAIIGQRTYTELHSNASCIAQKLLTSQKPVIKPGDKVLMVYVPGLDFIDAFFGCLRAKVIPVPVLPPDPMQRGGQALVKIENIAKSCGIVAILSTTAYHSAVRAGLVKNLISLSRKNGKSSARWPDLPWLHTEAWVKNSKNSNMGCLVDQCESQSSDICFLQFTSGSTGDAKGVMITHGGLVHNVKLMRRRYKSTSRTVLISWLPQYHDMGLIGGLFTSLVSGGTAILFSPITFIKKPLLWLETISKYRGTHSAGPNFAFELVIRRLDSDKDKLHSLDLSSMTFLMVAAEPVREKTLKRFIELTSPFGLSQKVMAPGYGLAENCVFVSCAFGEGHPIFVDWQGRVCCGYVQPGDADVDIRIVDPESGDELQEDGKEGEIWISSPSAGIGYWGREELSQKTYKNKLQNCPGRNYTRTGDLGRIIYGKLFITGRIKDLIIVAGRNIYSADVEKTVESSSELLRPGCCAVIGVPEEILSTKGISIPDGSDQVGLVVIAEVRDGKAVGKDVIQQIQTRVAEEHGVNVASVKLVKPRTISKTTSGKIKRFECLKQFTDGTLNLAPQPISTKKIVSRSFSTGTLGGHTPRSRIPPTGPRITNQEIMEFLKGLISEQTGIPANKISVTDNLTSYGLDSIGVVKATQKLSDFLGMPVAAIDVFTASCIQELANFSENLILKSQPQHESNPSHATELEIDSTELVMDVTKSRQFGIRFLQLLALLYMSIMLVFPAYLSTVAFLGFIPGANESLDGITWSNYLISLSLAPLAWILCIVSTCICISLFGTSFLRPNYTLTPEISIYSMDFVKWWALYKIQEISSKVLAVHLRGTVFLKYWFEMLGARIGSSVLLDTIDITDPSLVSIGDEVVIAEGVLIQSHEVKNGLVSFLPIRIGKNSSIGPYAVIQKGSIIREGTEVQPLQKVEAGKHALKATKLNNVDKIAVLPVETNKAQYDIIYQFMGIYLVGFLNSLAAATVYFLYIWFFQKAPSLQHLSFVCLSGAFHWIPFTVVAYVTMFSYVPSNPVTFAISLSSAYLLHGLILSSLTCLLTRLLTSSQKQTQFKTWLQQQIIIACHLRFAKLLTGTEAFCIYLRFLGAKIGKHCSIRAINPVSNPELLSIGAGVHLGDFSRIVTGFHSCNGHVSGKVKIEDNSVVGSQSLILPGSTIQKNVIIGALSVAPINSTLQEGGVYIGSQTQVAIRNSENVLDERIEEMDLEYKKIVSNLSANLAITTMNAKARYFHRIGVSGKGHLKIYDKIEGFPLHKIFHPGKSYPVIVRHSNSLSADDDARIDARGASLKIFSDEPASSHRPLYDLTLKTGNAFYARTISDFATWLVCGLAAREEFVKRFPHVRDAVWNSLRHADSYTKMHYYSNFCRLIRFEDGQQRYIKLKLRPYDTSISEDSGKVEPIGILPPETGAIPRDENDKRPLLFLADDFQQRVNSPGGVRYVLQLQLRAVPDDEATRDILVDCTKPWDANEFPYIDVGEININQILAAEESERLDFNPYLRSHELDVIHATSKSQSASIDHGRSLIYEISQKIRNKEPLPEALRNFIEQSDVKVDLSSCPMAASLPKKESQEVTLTRTWYQTFSAIFTQPLMQTLLPYVVVGLAIFAPLNWVVHQKNANKLPLHWLLPLFWIFSGALAALTCVVAKYVLVGSNKVGETVAIWSQRVTMDSTWQAIRSVVGDYFMEMTSGSYWFVVWMKLMGADVDMERDAYVDSVGVLLNPEMVRIGKGGCVGREALFFGHIYEGEGGMVKFGEITIGEDGFVGSRAVLMPGVQVEGEGSLSALSLAMKEEIVRSI
ncbi:Long-chain-fatty-acid--AMP ligase FadD28 [Senna tora]|uniref:Long-chain-fatty-acid--AMP ligase FadD28 n=1 Tax=Senna tora TaxID=362788 RepID=A0A834SMV9_9FABA|nr:Long-chain-fatty-acid--AMP ligase FadD28 [Senna tora]